jgi:maltooligosyltrehalose trehalohydrolase
MKNSHLMPFGAELRDDGSVRFRLWAPQAQRVHLSLENRSRLCLPLLPANNGWFELVTCEAAVGALYKFRIDGSVNVPDPASRFQPANVHGPSEVIDARAFEWRDEGWFGRPWEEAVIYEVHIGAFSGDGTFRAVEQKLDYLCDLGVTAVELMPVADFPGHRNWGYDGVLPYAPDSTYGRPEDLKHLVQAAHAKGMMMFLDVVYNHFGPEGNYLHAYSPQFFTKQHRTPWGDAINFDGEDSRIVRDFFLHNALYWIEEYHFDGLRLDAVHAIFDDSNPDILTELAQQVRQQFENQRLVHLILENGNNAAHYLARQRQDRLQLYDGQWNDDIHHAVHVLITGESDGYYADYVEQPVPQLCRCLTQGFAYQGEYSAYHGANRGEPTAGLPLSAFISFLQNHDQIGNRAFGERIHRLASRQALRAAMEILLLAPSPPMLFMGEEFCAGSPFLYFCDFSGELASAVTDGRRNEFSKFAKFNSSSALELIPDPNAKDTFLQSKLDWQSLQEEGHAEWLDLYRTLLSIRRREIIPRVSALAVGRCESCGSQSGSLSIDWTHPDGSRIELRANVSGESRTIVGPFGKIFYSSSPQCSELLSAGCLPPWSVVWSLKR